MKKMLALLCCLLTLSIPLCSLAQAPEGITYEGVWVRFEDGFEIYLPSDWMQMEVTEEMLASGLFYVAYSPDGERTCQLVWSALKAETTLEALHAQLAVVYPDATIGTFNHIGMIAYTDTFNNMMALISLDATQPGIYVFGFTPADDPEMQQLAAMIASTIRMIEE